MSYAEKMTNPIAVGSVKIPAKDPIRWSYKDVTYDEDKWASADRFLPLEYDLCYLKTKDDRIVNGWYTGQTWDGLHVIDNRNIKYWKKAD